VQSPIPCDASGFAVNAAFPADIGSHPSGISLGGTHDLPPYTAPARDSGRCRRGLGLGSVRDGGHRAGAGGQHQLASVNADGTLNDGNGVSSVTHIGTGQYEVMFSANAASCAYAANGREPVNTANIAIRGDRVVVVVDHTVKVGASK
jgi:hypothetical protein